MVACAPADLVAMWSKVADRIASAREELNGLDRTAGDGDHGENMQRGFAAVAREIRANPPADVAASFELVGTGLIADVAGSAGFLFGNAMIRAGRALGEAGGLDANAVAKALGAAIDIIQRRGKAARGDKTVLDALFPAFDAVGALPPDAPLARALSVAADAAKEGAAGTAQLVATKGRASYVGDRGLGIADAGATSAALILSALQEFAVGQGT